MSDSPFSTIDAILLQADQGWLKPDAFVSANEEWGEIQPYLREHREVLKVRIEVYVAAEQWEYVLEVAQTRARELPRDFFNQGTRLSFLRRDQKDFPTPAIILAGSS